MVKEHPHWQDLNALRGFAIAQGQSISEITFMQMKAMFLNWQDSQPRR